MLAAFGVSVCRRHGDARDAGARASQQTVYTWIASGDLQVGATF